MKIVICELPRKRSMQRAYGGRRRENSGVLSDQYQP